MSNDADDAADAAAESDTDTDGPRAELRKTKQRLEAEADRAVSEFDDSVVDMLAWLLDTETRARIYVYLRQNPHSTSEEIAEGTGLYPSTVREALADLHDEETVRRKKRDSDSAGNNPYEYEAIAPSNLVRGVVGELQAELNTIFNLDAPSEDDGPVTISIGDDDHEAVDIEIQDAEDVSDEADAADGDDATEADETDASSDTDDSDTTEK